MIFKLFRGSKKIYNSARLYSNTVNKEYTVPSVCNLNILLSFNTVLKPIDVIQYPDNDKVIIKCNKNIQCNQIGEALNISSSQHNYDNNVTCEILAPVKSNFNITSMGDIKISDFQGEAIRMFSEFGNVTIENTHNELISARANKGFIRTLGSIEAYRVELKTLFKGKIDADKIKCLGLKIETDDGDITTSSCYSEQSYIVTKRGTLNLENVHKHCKVLVEDDSRLNMIGFDGVLELKMNKGNADIQVSNIRERSSIEIKNEGRLTLRLGESVIEKNEVIVLSKGCDVDDNIPHEENDDDDAVYIRPKINKDNVRLKVTCPQSYCTVKAADWNDMIQKKIGKSATK